MTSITNISGKVRYRTVTGLLYPASLGAAVSWWVEAATRRPPQGEDGPIPWAMWFGVWFLVYHCVWYAHLIGEAAEPSTLFTYPARRFASDLVGVAAIIGGFAALGFASGEYQLYLPGVFAAAGFIPLSALLGHRHRRLGNSALIIIAALAAATGVAAHLGANASVFTSLDVTLLREFWLVLLAYLFIPSVFGTKTEHAKTGGFTGEIYGVE
jgi:hypothetical protein